MKNIKFLIIQTLLMLYKGFVIVKLWNWFITPLGIIQINLWHALGVMVLFKLLTYQYTGKELDENDKNTVIIVLVLFYNLVFGFGYLFHLFM